MVKRSVGTNLKQVFKAKNIVALAICFVIVSLMSIGYSALSTELNIKTDVTLRGAKDVFISRVELINATSGAKELYSPKHSSHNINAGVSLDNLNDSLTYKVYIRNEGKTPVEIVDFYNDFFSNNDFEHIIEGLKVSDVIAANTTHEFKFTFKRKIIGNSDELHIAFIIVWQPYIAPY